MLARDARYHRALTLVQLERYLEARPALARFAEGGEGGFHQEDAAALLETLDRRLGVEGSRG